MPKKKLTKTQVKRLLNSANAAIYKLALDRLQHGTGSLIPISFKKLETMLGDLGRAIDKL
tara:strand:+ start:2328 stop:2507 length:180 start_codon:yes stop_codon:yes gene_type:complete